MSHRADVKLRNLHKVPVISIARPQPSNDRHWLAHKSVVRTVLGMRRVYQECRNLNGPDLGIADEKCTLRSVLGTGTDPLRPEAGRALTSSRANSSVTLSPGGITTAPAARTASRDCREAGAAAHAGQTRTLWPAVLLPFSLQGLLQLPVAMSALRVETDGASLQHRGGSRSALFKQRVAALKITCDA